MPRCARIQQSLGSLIVSDRRALSSVECLRMNPWSAGFFGTAWRDAGPMGAPGDIELR
jgi:hypothetical protein